jgi:hypothetical protein
MMLDQTVAHLAAGRETFEATCAHHAVAQPKAGQVMRLQGDGRTGTVMPA